MTLSTLEAIQSRPYRAAALLLSTGQTRTILKSERVIFAPDLNLLTVGSEAYRVPAHLFEATRRALSVGRVHI